MEIVMENTIRLHEAGKSRADMMSGGDVDNEGGWSNKAYDLIEGLLGEDVLEVKLDAQFEDALDNSSSGFIDGLNSKLQKAKSDFFHPQKFHHKDYDCNPIPVGGAGFMKIVSNPQFPHHEFFRANRYFSVRVRHNNLTFTDDAMLDARVCSIKFKDSEQGGDLDLILYSGRVPFFYNSTSFHKCYEAFKGGTDVLKLWTMDAPCNYYGLVECLRRNPTSYYDQWYYSHVTYHLVATDSSQWLARIRLIPGDESAETGRLGDRDQEQVWDMERWCNGERRHNYLRAEYRERFREGVIIYRLQIQYRNFDLTDPHVLNPCVEWREGKYPWQELAVVALTHPLSPAVLAKTQINLLTKTLQNFKPVEPQEMKDFCSLVLLLREFHGVTANSSGEDDEEEGGEEEGEEEEVTVEIKTGDMANAGTDSDVYITLIGSRARTRTLYLDTPMHDDFESGQLDVFNLKIPEIGEILSVKLELRSILPNRRWFIDYVTIERRMDSGQTSRKRYPCYQWVTTSNSTVYARSGSGILVQKDEHSYSLLQRKYELDQRRARYVWESVEGLPSRIACSKYDELPRQIKFTREKERDLMAKYLRTLTNTGSSVVTSLFDSWDVFKDYDKLLTNVLKDTKTVKKIAEIWLDDEEFGRQVLCGPHPIHIRRLEKLPHELTNLGMILGDLLDRGQTLTAEVANGHMYFLDYPELANLEQSNDYKGKYVRYITYPECYLYSTKRGTLIPIAINIPNHEGEQMLFTPKDSYEDWILAKMWVREADAQVHHVISRHLKSHLIMEVVAMATIRSLPSCHPVYKLLIPHLRYTITLNVLGRHSLYPKDDGLFVKFLAIGEEYVKLLKHAYEDFDISDLFVPKDLLDRGVADPEKLPNYPYRDDGLKLWESIKKLVRTLLFLHYHSEENVLGDGELQEWLYDMTELGFGGNRHGLPEYFHSLFHLTDFITAIVFTASCQNSCLTQGMMDYYSFVPNAPSMLLGPPPTAKGKTSMDDIRAMLPSRGKTAEIVAACYTLSRLGKDEVFLGDFPEEYFDEDAILATIVAFQEDLKRIAEDIEKRNEAWDIPYTYLLPGKIPNSISM